MTCIKHLKNINPLPLGQSWHWELRLFFYTFIQGWDLAEYKFYACLFILHYPISISPCHWKLFINYICCREYHLLDNHMEILTHILLMLNIWDFPNLKATISNFKDFLNHQAHISFITSYDMHRGHTFSFWFQRTWLFSSNCDVELLPKATFLSEKKYHPYH